MIRVIEGSAALGQEYAGLQFTNTGHTACVLYGYPEVRLLLHGKVIGQSAQPSVQVNSTRMLAPGASTQSLLHDYTSCEAPLSDSVRVTVPGSTLSVVRPGELRACALRVDPLAAAQ